jgi:hypothetical protein
MAFLMIRRCLLWLILGILLNATKPQEVRSLALLLDSTVKLFPDALDLNVSLVHAPAAANRALIFARHFLDQRQEADRPSVDRGVVDRDAALLHYLLDMPIAQRISGVPADADQDHVDREAHTFEVEHVDLSGIWHRILPERPASVR